jgi:hypothetical protein
VGSSRYKLRFLLLLDPSYAILKGGKTFEDRLYRTKRLKPFIEDANESIYTNSLGNAMD